MRNLQSKTALWILLFSLTLSSLAACSRATATVPASMRLKVVATTTLIGDVVRQIAGDAIELVELIPPGADPHTFEPRPQDIAALSEADIVFINGLGLEEALEPVLDANVRGARVVVSEGVAALPFQGSEAGEEDHAASDPHTWMDPNNVIVWAQNIVAALSQADPQNAGAYRGNAEAYISELRALDGWIREQVAQIPPQERKLVTDHATYGYFAHEYGFEQVGLVVPALSTNAAPSAQELADLETNIREHGVRAVFVDKTINPTLSEQVAKDSGVQIIIIYSGSLSEEGEEADSYLKFMRYNVNAIVNALK